MIDSDKEELKEAEETLKALADTTRIEILLTIGEDEKCVHDIAEAADQNLSNISHHLRRLRDKKLVDYRREGRHKFYRIMDDHVLKILKEGMEHAGERE